ncbi:hypothetical protein V500_07002 [Pseudogymnoascus sp. VKM F-4518 (FW-2643)]|nr:hypothetical protein V500_07002 [Pseudogymnoascus sp. VKM F-4518 (FW-2643)]
MAGLMNLLKAAISNGYNLVDRHILKIRDREADARRSTSAALFNSRRPSSDIAILGTPVLDAFSDLESDFSTPGWGGRHWACSLVYTASNATHFSTMSFGFSSSDIALVIQLAVKVIDNSRGAIGEQHEFVREMSSLHIALQRLKYEKSKPGSLLNREKDDRIGELDTIIKDCRGLLKPVKRQLERYNGLADEKKRGFFRAWQSFRFGNLEMRKLIDVARRISQYKDSISLYLNLICVGSQGRVERWMYELGGEVREMRLEINRIAVFMQAGGIEGSILTSYAEDDKAAWRDLRRSLSMAGFQTSTLDRYRDNIKDYLMELGKRGALDDVPETEYLLAPTKNDPDIAAWFRFTDPLTIYARFMESNGTQPLSPFFEEIVDADFLPGAHPNCEGNFESTPSVWTKEAVQLPSFSEDFTTELISTDPSLDNNSVERNEPPEELPKVIGLRSDPEIVKSPVFHAAKGGSESMSVLFDETRAIMENLTGSLEYLVEQYKAVHEVLQLLPKGQIPQDLVVLRFKIDKSLKSNKISGVNNLLDQFWPQRPIPKLDEIFCSGQSPKKFHNLLRTWITSLDAIEERLLADLARTARCNTMGSDPSLATDQRHGPSQPFEGPSNKTATANPNLGPWINQYPTEQDYESDPEPKLGTSPETSGAQSGTGILSDLYSATHMEILRKEEITRLRALGFSNTTWRRWT